MTDKKEPLCSIPFIMHTILPIEVRTCCDVCLFEDPYIDPIEAWNHPEVQKLRKHHIEHDFDNLNDMCTACLKSKPRVYSAFKKEAPASYSPKMDYSSVKVLMVNLSNECTNACRMCTSQQSLTAKRIRRKSGGLTEGQFDDKPDLLELNHADKVIYEIIKDNDHVTVLNILGGNAQDQTRFPEMMENVQSMKKLKELVITTNAKSEFCMDKESIFDKVNRLKNVRVRFNVSMDGAKKSHEYQRVFSNFDNCNKFIDKAIDLGYVVSLSTTISNDNILHVDKFVDYALEFYVPRGIQIFGQVVEQPTIYAPWNIPKDLKVIALQRIHKVSNKVKTDYSLFEFINSVRYSLTRKATKKEWDMYCYHTMKMDNYLKVVSINPEFEPYIDNIAVSNMPNRDLYTKEEK